MHAFPAGWTRSGQLPEASQTSARSQSVVASRQGVPLGRLDTVSQEALVPEHRAVEVQRDPAAQITVLLNSESVGHVSLFPSHSSAGSQTPAEGRHTVRAFPPVGAHVLSRVCSSKAKTSSTSHGLLGSAARHTVPSSGSFPPQAKTSDSSAQSRSRVMALGAPAYARRLFR